LALGLSVDVDRVDPATAATIVAELLTNLSPADAPTLNDPAATLVLLNENAVIGIVVVDTNLDGTLDLAAGDEAGATCALCHTITDGSVYEAPDSGSIGRRKDGRAAHALDFGSLVALGTNSRAYYPLLQLALDANGGATLGRAPTGLTEASTEAEVDAYLTNRDFYPVGTFDDTFDGNGDPMHNPALFLTALAAPWGSEGTFAQLDNFNNTVFTTLLDPTTLTTPDGRAFLHALAGAAGDEIADDDYVQILTETNVTGYPYVVADVHPSPGSEAAVVGLRVDNQKLLDLNGYLDSLAAPAGVAGAADAIATGRDVFRHQCTQCHNVDQSLFVPPFTVAMNEIWPGDAPVTLATREAPLNDIVNSVGIFDDKMAVVNASIRGDIRGIAMPVLLDLARKPNYLHDGSVPSLGALLDGSRGPDAPHPFSVEDPVERAGVIAFLKSLDAR
jgi:mono/diheme cytochrome c family protein